MSDELATRLLALLVQEDGMSAAKAAKKLGLSMSQLQRLLASLSDSAALGGLNLISTTEDEGRLLLWLTPKGRQFFAGTHGEH